MAATRDPSSIREEAVIQAEARHLARTLAPYRVLHHDALKELIWTSFCQVSRGDRAAGVAWL